MLGGRKGSRRRKNPRPDDAEGIEASSAEQDRDGRAPGIGASRHDTKVAGSPVMSHAEFMDSSGLGGLGASAAPPGAAGMPAPEYADMGPGYAGTPSDTAVDPFDPIDDEPENEAETPPKRARWIPKNALRVGVVAAAMAVVLGGSVGAWALTGGGSDGEANSVDPERLAAAVPMTDAQRKAIQVHRRTRVEKRASRDARKAAHDKKVPFHAKGTPPPPPTPEASEDSDGGGAPSGGDPVPAGKAQEIARGMLPDYGWSPSSQFGCLVKLWNRESGWNVHASNPSGAYGIPQAKPGSKMSSAGPDWRNSARTQIEWGLGYIKSRYGSPCDAWAHSQAAGWY